MAAKKKKAAAKKAPAKKAAKKAAAPKKAKAAKKAAAPKKAKAAKKAPQKAAKKAAKKAAAPKKASYAPVADEMTYAKVVTKENKAPPVTPAKAGAYKAAAGLPPARFCWWDLITTDVDKAQKFYTSFLPWSLRPVELPPLGLTQRISANNMDLGGLVHLSVAEGIASHWMPYAQVQDLDRVVKRAKELSGFVPVPPTELEGIGRFAVIADPRGAHISVVETKLAMTPPTAASFAPGVVCWNEAHTDNVDTTARFFGDVLGWERAAMDMGGMTYTMFKAGEEDRGGAMSDPQMPPQWVTAFLVDDVEAALQKAKDAGGEVVMGVTEVPSFGRQAMLKDPTGALFTIFQGTTAAGEA